jgi:ubiquinone/menaquinone biosynthesis C-methylase UbiE
MDAISIQRDYYRKTAGQYDATHVGLDREHDFALAFMSSMIDYLKIGSMLDIGSGTGRALLQIKKAHPHLEISGVEPSSELREIGYAKGLSRNELTDGDAHQLTHADGAFDLVCEFAALHHISNPDKAVSEMLRVAKKAIFISDANNFGQGNFAIRTVKQIIRSMRLWPLADFVKTRGKGYSISEGDGLAYSFSVFDSYREISKCCKSVHIINTVPAGINLYRSAGCVALLGLKSP